MSAASPQRDRTRLQRFLSSSFEVERGTRTDPAGVRGYPIDFRVKALQTTMWAGFAEDPGAHVWVGPIQRGLGCFERHVAGEGEEWLAAARETADLLVREQREDGGWEHRFHYPHTFDIEPPWLSGMAQGEGASLLARVHAETGEERYEEAARRALGPLGRTADEGGASAPLGSALVPEEYPTRPPSLVLNGMIFGLWGLRDVAVAYGDADARAAFEAGVDALAASIDRWDTGWWSAYDLHPHRVRNVASIGYHALHVAQLEATHELAPRPALAEAARRWAGYAESPAARARAWGAKVAFRLAVPRNPRVARALPWARGGRA
ncbi:MAG TPA: D-glucuronyl C5-epimerase family protein [Thermoleophilaceae bacterium]